MGRLSGAGSARPSDFLVSVARGLVPGHSLVHEFGRNPKIDTNSDPEDVWSAGGLMTWPTVAGVVSLVSDSTDDDGDPTTNTGAQTVTVEGLDANFDALIETVTMNGTSAVTTSGSFIRVDMAFVATVGTYHDNNIGTILGTIGGDTMFSIEPAAGQTELGRITIPNGKTGYLIGGAVSVNSSKVASVSMWEMHSADDVTQPYSGVKHLLLEFDGMSGDEEIHVTAPIRVDEKTDVWFEVTMVTANSTAIEVDFEFLMVDN